VSDAQEKTKIERLEKRLADLKARMPAHSIPPSMMIELDELEEQLAELQAGEIMEEQAE